MVTVDTNKNLALPPMDIAWGTEGVLSNDLILPRLMLMQALSIFVSDENIGAKAGEIRDSIEGRFLGSTKTPVQIVPFFSTNTWVVSKEVNGKFEFDKVEPRKEGERREYEEIVGGVKKHNSACINIYCLVYDDLLTGMVTPYEVSFKSYSFKHAGRSFAQLATRLKANNKPLPSVVFDLGVKLEENDKGKFYCYTLALAKDAEGKVINTSNEILAQAYTQYKQISAAYLENRLKSNQESEETVSAAPEQF